VAAAGLGALVAAASLLAMPVVAQQLDAGQMELLSGGRRVSVESFRVWRAGGVLNAVANLESSGAVGGSALQVGLQLGADQRPSSYRLEEAGGSTRVQGQWTIDRAQLHITSPEGERWKELPSEGMSTVLERGVAHHYLVLVQMLRDSPGSRVIIIVPSLGERTSARLAGEQRDDVTIGDRTVVATRYDLEVGPGRQSVWLDAEGRLLRVSDPGGAIEALRMPSRD
jgi:hypothetical protein